MKGTIFAIKKYAIHDGPNIRTTVFLKGCPLRCRWCHNPEGLDRNVQMVWRSTKCVGCGECVKACPASCLSMTGAGVIRETSCCTDCRQCAEICPALAQESTGWQTESGEILAEIEKDIAFFDESGGGVTFSGGEPLLQPQFLLDLLHRCGELGIHRAVDTCAFATTELLLEVAQNCELFLIDLKHMDSDKHLIYTGVGNERILENIRVLAGRGCAFLIRIPLIEGFNSDEDNIRRSGEFLASLSVAPQVVDLLPYHTIAEAKYAKLGCDGKMMKFPPMTSERVDTCRKILTDFNLNVQVGG